jgi:hypothetical protein
MCLRVRNCHSLSLSWIFIQYHKSLWVDDCGTEMYFKMCGGYRRHLISYAQTEQTLKFLKRMLNISLGTLCLCSPKFSNLFLKVHKKLKLKKIFIVTNKWAQKLPNFLIFIFCLTQKTFCSKKKLSNEQMRKKFCAPK